MTSAPIRRAFFDPIGRVGVETEPGVLWILPWPEGKRYDPHRMMEAVKRAGRVETDRWERINNDDSE